MTKVKISATVQPEWLAEARAVTVTTNLSQLFDDALAAIRRQGWGGRPVRVDAAVPGNVADDRSVRGVGSS